MNYVTIRESLVQAGEDLERRFRAGESVVALVRERAQQIDDVLVGLWREHIETTGTALVAVGGYGRGELHPSSDVDVMLLVPDELTHGAEEAISGFVAGLWDIGLEIGHSVRTLDQCHFCGAITTRKTKQSMRRQRGPATPTGDCDVGKR